MLFAYQRRKAKALGLGLGTVKAKTGSVTFLQLAGGAIHPHPHFHSVLPDGVFMPTEGGKAPLVPLPAPTAEEVHQLA